MDNEVMNPPASSTLHLEDIQKTVEDIITKARSLYNNDPKCYKKGRGVDDQEFKKHCTKEAIEEMIEEKLEGLSTGDILTILSYSILHYYIIKVEHQEDTLYPDKDKDILTLQQAYKGELTDEDIHNLANHILYYSCRIYYYALIDKRRVEKENRKKDEELLNKVSSDTKVTTVNIKDYPYQVREGHYISGVWHHYSCKCAECEKLREKEAEKRQQEFKRSYDYQFMD